MNIASLKGHEKMNKYPLLYMRVWLVKNNTQEEVMLVLTQTEMHFYNENVELFTKKNSELLEENKKGLNASDCLKKSSKMGREDFKKFETCTRSSMSLRVLGFEF